MAKAARRKAKEPGYDGRTVHIAPVRITATRSEPRMVRSRPGDFHWRYNRKSANIALFHAGIEFSTLWERAGIAAAGSPNWEGSSSTAWKGLPDGRVQALDDLRGIMREVGMLGSARLQRYCVNGETASEIGNQFGIAARDMAVVLESDLRTCALYLRML